MEMVGEDYFVCWICVAFDDAELNDVQIVGLLLAWAVEVTGRIRVDRLRFCEIRSHPQERQSPETAHHPDAARTLRFSVTFFPWPPKTSHDQAVLFRIDYLCQVPTDAEPA